MKINTCCGGVCALPFALGRKMLSRRSSSSSSCPDSIQTPIIHLFATSKMWRSPPHRRLVPKQGRALILLFFSEWSRVICSRVCVHYHETDVDSSCGWNIFGSLERNDNGANSAWRISGTQWQQPAAHSTAAAAHVCGVCLVLKSH